MNSPSKTKTLIWVSAILAGVWLAGCQSTPAPRTPMPPQPKSTETTEAPSAPPSQSRPPGQSGPQSESQPSQTTAKQSGGPPKQAPAEKSQSRPAAPEDPGEAAVPEAAQKTGAQPSEAMPTAESKLEKARDDLAVSEATERKIAAELEQLKKSGNASAEDIRNYEIYHERVKAMVAENRKTVAKMEQAYSKHTPGEKAPSAADDSGLPKSSHQSIPGEQSEDQVAALDRQLTASLNEFDAMLLKEMETIETQSAAKMRDLAQEAAEAAKRLKAKGVDLGSDETESAEDGSEQGEQAEEGQQGAAGETDTASKEKGSPSEPGSDEDEIASRDRSAGGGSGPTGKRGSRYSKEDDDIVARQLREAAEKETDPVLKEKLWKEYEDYKRNTQ